MGKNREKDMSGSRGLSKGQGSSQRLKDVAMMMMCCWDPFVGVSSGESEAIDGNSAFGGVFTVTLSRLPAAVCVLALFA
jgi:hypothetical protein